MEDGAASGEAAALAAFAASKPGRSRPVDPGVVAELRAENTWLVEAVKELAIELSPVAVGEARWG